MSSLPVSSFDDDIISELLGPFRILVKFTLLDCSARSKCLKLFTCLLSIIIIVLLFARVGLLMETKGNSLSFPWAESNFFGFPAIFAAVCALCVFGWTKNGFILKFTKKLARVRQLRVESNSKMNGFRLIQVLCLIFSIPWLVAMMSWIVYNFTHGKIFYGADESNIIFRVLLLISNGYIWYISTVCLAHYVLVFSALNREVHYFNEELKKAKQDRLLKNIGILEKFDFRQNEILEMILSANESLSSFGCFAPLFLFYGLVNGVYLTSFMDSVPLFYFVILMFNLAAIIVYNLCILFPTCALQEHLTSTSKILINNDEFECSKDPIVYQTYRIMVDRLQKVDTRISVIAAFPITKGVLAAALFITPNLGFLLVMAKKVLIANGGHV
uniref:Gustatory receptor n=1 Tax=Caenorhabditis tropicalis TaxID=1561998 RepID=A0A1I7TYU5_9PELO